MNRVDVVWIGGYEFQADITQRIQKCFHTAINDHCKVFVVRLDIRFPKTYPHDGTNELVSELFRQLKYQYYRKDIDCRYVWAREQHQSDVPHYHLLLLLDGSEIDGGLRVWSAATRIWKRRLDADSDAYVHLAGNGIMIRRPSPRSEDGKLIREIADFERDYRAAFNWAIYLAKTHTKGNAPHGVREWGSSRF